MANTSPSPARHPVRALILTPTRELAVQVEESFRTYGKYTNLRSTVVYGGVDIKQQLPIVRGGVEILVATPGRLLDHIEQKSVYLGQVEIFVLDEADRMLDMGFIPDIKRIMALLPVTAKRQNLLFSATFSGEIKKLADQLLNAPQLIEVAKRNTAADTVSQSAYKVPAEAKRALLEHLVRSRNLTQVLCFMRTKHGVSRLARQLEKDGLVTDAIHGDKTQQARMEALAAFKEGKLQVLVATDVAARGLDIDDLPLVVNLRAAARARGLHPPDRPHGPRRRVGRGDLLRRARGGAIPRRHRAAAEEDDTDRVRRRIRPRDGAPRAFAGRAPWQSVRAPAARTARRAAERPPRAPRGEHAERPPRAPAGEHAERPPRAARATEGRAVRPPREDPRIERERAYALNPDQPPVAPPAADAGSGTSAPAPASARPKRHGFGHGRPVAALLMKRTASEPEKV